MVEFGGTFWDAAAARQNVFPVPHRTLPFAISIPIRRECRICMQRQTTFGGGVSPRNTRLRGQSIIEYVLIIAVIGLVIVFAGPGVAGAIRNQFNQVTNSVNSGTEGDSFISAEEKAYREAMKTVANKEAKDWTLDEQKAAATDIAKNGTSSVVYSKAKSAMNAGTKWSVKLTNGETMTYRIIGINHDDLADGSGKAGLTFEATNQAMGKQRMNSADTNVGGWEKSELRGRLNSGDLWSLLPTELQSKAKAVTKMTDNKRDGSATAGIPSSTTDKVFLLSISEVYGNLKSCAGYDTRFGAHDGTQYEYHASKGVALFPDDNSPRFYRWTRSVISPTEGFMVVYTNGNNNGGYPSDAYSVLPAWCF